MKQETLTRQQARRIGMRQSLRTFAAAYSMLHDEHKPGTVIVECVNLETGEVNSYICYDKATAKYIANTWWMVQDKEEAIITIKGQFWTHQIGGATICQKHVKQGLKQDKLMGNELDWYYLMESARLYQEMGYTTKC